MTSEHRAVTRGTCHLPPPAVLGCVPGLSEGELVVLVDVVVVGGGVVVLSGIIHTHTLSYTRRTNSSQLNHRLSQKAESLW